MTRLHSRPARSPVWHPFTQHATAPDPIVIARTEAARLITADGRGLIDAISSWWVVTHGHRHPAIMAAIREATESLDQVIFAGFTHDPAEALAHDLIAIAPPGLAHVFYSDSGSTAVEVALKMALGTTANRRARHRTRILALEHAYHGDTVGTMSVGARGVFTSAYEPLLFEVGRIPFPVPGTAAVDQALAALEAECRSERVAALIVEPLILGAGGMLMWEAHVLAEMARICRSHGVLLIADEVMTGFGRTGTLFACEQAGITPDILCLAKGLTGGALPLAATLATSEVFAAHYTEDRSKTFFHSSSYTANPIACAAARANLRIWREEPVRQRIAALAKAQSDRLAQVAGRDDRFAAPRCLGTITALDLPVVDAGYLSALGPGIYRHAIDNGVLLRPLGNTLYVLPPYCISESELDQVYQVIAGVPEAVAAGVR
ncbi:MAG: adenosylmethionine--8-amino-7-oxononanoate transaminase [Hyphomicrobiaceae bacterium]|nr:adenosylmethionine--8-amino-7-oxononanoate transaminase [Hyphomicrobiaceae bacterium]